MNIWIIVSKTEALTWEPNLRYKEEAEKMGWGCRIIAAETIDIIVNREDRKSVILEGEKTVLPDVIIPRTGSGSTYFVLALLRHFEKLGVMVLNSADSVLLAKDKLQSLQFLASANLPIPKTMLAKFPVSPLIIEKEFGFPFVMKKLSGSGGKGVVLIKDHQQLEDMLGMLDDTRKHDHGLIFQEFIENSSGRDLRVIVVGGRAIGAMLRTAKEGDFKANFSAGGSVETYELTAEIEWLAVESANALGLGLAGVDILFGKDGQYYICEVNSNPGIVGFEQSTGINVPEEVFHFLKLKSKF